MADHVDLVRGLLHQLGNLLDVLLGNEAQIRTAGGKKEIGRQNDAHRAIGAEIDIGKPGELFILPGEFGQIKEFGRRGHGLR